MYVTPMTHQSVTRFLGEAAEVAGVVMGAAAMAAAPATLGWEVEKSEGWEGADSNETHQITTVGGGVVGVRRACNIRLWGWLMVSAARTCDTSRAVTHGTTEESSIL